jgi:hypothetical protein
MSMNAIMIACALIAAFLKQLRPMATRAPRKRAFPMMSPEMTASFAADVRISARAKMLDAVLDVNSHPHLMLNADNDETDIHMHTSM